MSKKVTEPCLSSSQKSALLDLLSEGKTIDMLRELLEQDELEDEVDELFLENLKSLGIKVQTRITTA